MHLNGPLVFHGLIFEGIVLGPTGQVAAVVLDAGHVPEVALGHPIVGGLKETKYTLFKSILMSK